MRAHGLRQARYRGLAKVKLQNYFIAAACNLKRWIRREAWVLRQAVSAAAVKSLVETVELKEAKEADSRPKPGVGHSEPVRDISLRFSPSG